MNKIKKEKKLTKKQELIYNWLLSKPGYLKKSPKEAYLAIPSDIAFNDFDNGNFDKAFTKAKIDFKSKRVKIKQNLEGAKIIPKSSHPKFGKKVVLKSFKDIFPWIDDEHDGKLVKSKIIKFGTLGNSSIPNSIKKEKFDKNNTLVISDLHLPFCKEGYLEHCIKIRDKYKCGNIVLIGDEVDLCGVSQWEKDPDGFSAGTEASKAQEQLKLWYKAFPVASVCIGNHTARPFRQAKANGIPKKFMKSYEEAWEAPSTWKWAEHWEFNNVLYTHGTGFSGPNAAIRIATRHRQNTCIGHIHSEAGIQYSASKIDLVWGMQLGGALDDNTYAAYYAKDQLKKSIIGCGVVLNGELPIYEPMKL